MIVMQVSLKSSLTFAIQVKVVSIIDCHAVKFKIILTNDWHSTTNASNRGQVKDLTKNDCHEGKFEVISINDCSSRLKDNSTYNNARLVFA